MKQQQTFFFGIYSNLTLSNNIKVFKVFQRFSKSAFLSLMNKVNPKEGNETKSAVSL